MSKKQSISWMNEPEAHDYPAALSFLTLLYDESSAAGFVSRLQSVSVTTFKSRDIFRASELPLLGLSNERVERDRKKIREGEPLSPILLVRATALGKVVIADGYHRLCAVYSFDEDAQIPCKIV